MIFELDMYQHWMFQLEHLSHPQNREGGVGLAAQGVPQRGERLLQQDRVAVARRQRQRRPAQPPVVRTGT